MILSDSAILTAIEKGDIVISPFERKQLGSNSYDVRLSPHLAYYDNENRSEVWCTKTQNWLKVLDSKKDNKLTYFEIPEYGYILMPNRLYLGATLEYTETYNHVPFIDGKSSTGRLGMAIHITAGKCDESFCGHLTLEIEVVEPLMVYPNMLIGQLWYMPVLGEVINPYNKKKDAKYANQGAKPVGSQMFKNFK